MVAPGIGGTRGAGMAALLPLAVVVAVLWIPFGFSMTGLIEEWDLLGLFTIHGPLLVAGQGGPLAAHGLRPLMPLSFGIAYLIDVDSFDGWHLVMITALLLKGAAFAYLLTYATGSRAWGVVGAVLFLIYPADTMQLSFRSLHINTALALSLSGCALIVAAFRSHQAVRAFSIGCVAALLFLAGACTYEAAMMLIALPLGVAYARRGWRLDALRQQRALGLAALWISTAAVYAVFAALLAKRIASYQGQVFSGQRSMLAAAADAWTKLISVGGARALLGGWLDAVGMVATEHANFLYLIGGASAVILAVLVAIRVAQRDVARHVRASPESYFLPARLMLVGVLATLMGYAPFLTSASHIAISQRTFLWATPGATMVWTVVLMMAWRLARIPSVALAVALLTAGLGGQLFQFHHYVAISERQRSLLRQIVENFDPDQSTGKTLVVLDGTGQMGHTWLFPDEGLRYALSYLYGKAVGPFEVCRVPSMEWQRVDTLGRKGICTEDSAGWTFVFPSSVSAPGVAPTVSQPSRRVLKEDAVVVSIPLNAETARQANLQEHLHRLQTGQEPASRRYRGILEARSPRWFGRMFRDQSVGERYRWDFGDWWSLELPPRGAGWREAEWNGNGLSHRSAAWKSNGVAELYIELAPTSNPYRMRGEFDQFASDAVRRSMSVRINAKALELRWVSQFRFEVEIPVDVLVRGTNRLEFVSDLDDRYYGLSARLDFVTVEPR
jgi:hypothetical protein